MGRGLLNISASCLALPDWAFLSVILPLIQRGEKWRFSCWRWWESSGEMCHLLSQLLCSMLSTYFYELLPEQHSGLDGYLLYLIHHSQFLRSSGTGLTAIWETCSTPYFGMDTPPHRRLSPAFSLGMHNFQFCTVKAPQNVRRGLCCLPVGDNLITAHGAGRVSSCLPGPVFPQLEAQSPPLSCDPLPLVHREIFARPCAAWASKPTRPWWIFSTAGQALKDIWLTVSWDVSDPPTALRHLEAALHSLLTSQFSPWFLQALRVVIKRGFWVPTTVPTCKGS